MLRFLAKKKDRTSLIPSFFLAEEGRFELPRQVAPTYSFSKAAPSATWVLLRAFKSVA